MTETAPDSVAPPPEAIPIPPDMRTSGADGSKPKKRFKKNMLILAAVVFAALLVIWMTKSGKPSGQNGSVANAPQLKHGDPTLTPDAIAEKEKQKDAENAAKINTPAGMQAGMSYIPAPTKEIDDPLAQFATAQGGTVQPVAAPKDAPPATTAAAPPPTLPQPIPTVPLPQGGPTAMPPAYGAPPHPVTQSQATSGGGDGNKMLKSMQGLQSSSHEMDTLRNEVLVKRIQESEKAATAVPVSNTGGAQVLSGTTQKENKPVLRKLGQELPARLDLEANSDSAKFVQATVTSGPFQGAIFQGKFTKDEDTLEIKFDHASFRNAEYEISAIAVDPDQRSLGMATDVNHHYFTRLGGLFVAGFAKGFSTALSQSGESVSIGGAGGAATTTILPSKTYPQAAVIGAGDAFAGMSGIAAAAAQRPVTVKIATGTPISILFTEDWIYDASAVRKTARIPVNASTSDDDGTSLVPAMPVADVGGDVPR